eukprot:6186112-Pleurochrysis_carterae.AAC.1
MPPMPSDKLPRGVQHEKHVQQNLDLRGSTMEPQYKRWKRWKGQSPSYVQLSREQVRARDMSEAWRYSRLALTIASARALARTSKGIGAGRNKTRKRWKQQGRGSGRVSRQI